MLRQLESGEGLGLSNRIGELAMQRQLALDAARLGWWHYDPRSRISTWDPRYKEIFGVSEDSKPNEEILKRLHPEDLPRVWAAVEAALNPANPRPYAVEYRICLPDGGERWIEAHGVATFEGRGSARQAVSFVGTVQDITERKTAENRQAHLTEVLRAIRNVNQLITQEKDRDRLLRRAVAMLTETRGYRLAWIGLDDAPGAFHLMAASGMDGYGAELTRQIEARGGPDCWRRLCESGTALLVVPDKTTDCAGCALCEIRQEQASLIGLLMCENKRYGLLAVVLPVGMAHDHEEQSLFREVCGDLGFALRSLDVEAEGRRAQAALVDSEAQFRTLVESAPVAIFIQTQGAFAYLNAAALPLFGVPDAATLLGRPVIASFHPDDRKCVGDRIRRLNDERQAVPVLEERILRADGSVIVAEFMAVPFAYRGDTGALVFGRDVTERKRASDEHERLTTQLAQAQKMESIGRLAGGVAHDFNNMLGVILGHAELARDQLPSSHPAAADLAEIRQAAARSADLTRQLLAFARKQTIAPKVLDINVTVEGMLKMLRRLIGENLDLVWHPGREVGRVLMDPSQIDQILANLCVNARDAIKDTGKVTIETRGCRFDAAACARQSGCMPGEYVMLAVSDNGSGMDRVTQARLFEPFFTTKPTGQGTGLGLATVYGIVQQNNGFINVYSEPGSGTTFKIYLPLYGAKHDQAGDVGQTADSIAMGGHGTILLVEDEPSLLRMTTRILRTMGYQVLAATGPDAALQLARTHQETIRLLITDVVMPTMNGRELADQLVALRPGLKVLYMSGYTANVIAHHGVLEPSVRFIAKPFSTRELADQVRAALT